MKESSQTRAAEIYEWFTRYLIEADIYLLDENDFEIVKEAFIEYNTKPMIEHPGKILTAEEAYSKKNAITMLDHKYQKEPKNQNEESGCGLPPSFLEALFILQHVTYTDEVLKKTSHVYKAIRTYKPENNRAMLQKIKQQKDNPYAAALINWASRKQPIHVKDRVHLILKFTPGHPGNLVFHMTDAGILGSNEPFEEDRSKYVELDVFNSPAESTESQFQPESVQHERFDDEIKTSNESNIKTIFNGIKKQVTGIKDRLPRNKDFDE